jgi:ankyrin repeat protein
MVIIPVGPILYILKFLFYLVFFIIYKITKLIYKFFSYIYLRLTAKKIHTIFWATHEKKFNLVKYFIEEDKVHVDFVEDDKVGTPLVVAISVNDYKITEYLLEKGANVNFVLSDESTPLIHAVGKRETHEIAQLLIDNGAYINYTSKQGITPLIAALMNYDNLENVRLLIEHGATLNYCAENEMSPLFFAVAFTDKKTVEYLLDHGAKSFVGTYRMMPLHGAIQKGDLSLVQLLISRGEDHFAILEDGTTLKEYALTHNQTEIAEYFDTFQ